MQPIPINTRYSYISKTGRDMNVFQCFTDFKPGQEDAKGKFLMNRVRLQSSVSTTQNLYVP